MELNSEYAKRKEGPLSIRETQEVNCQYGIRKEGQSSVPNTRRRSIVNTRNAKRSIVNGIRKEVNRQYGHAKNAKGGTGISQQND